jgi:hypothetical protein
LEYTIYYLLGHIDNYAGGFSSDDGIFKHISFLNFDWQVDDEKIKKSNKLLKACEKVLAENKLPNDIYVEKSEENKGITIFSKNITSLINNFLKTKSSVFGRDYLEINNVIFDKFERWNENSNSHKQRLQFLYGVIDSNATANEFYFFNGFDKCQLTQYVLRCFADEDDQITVESYFRTPWVDKLTVNKEGDIWKRILKKYCK